jgi:hypothetical protein
LRRLLLAALAAVSLAASLGLPPPTAAGATSPKVAIIVGPVGSLTPTYLHFAELAAAAATQGGATVARAYSPNATPANVLAAVADANVVIYFGHGYGHPSPYGGLDTGRQNGWGLQGPRARGTHGDSLGGELAYYGEDWIVANARPAPGFVMIYSNTCYAPGASEGGHAAATESVALQRVAHYSRKVFAMGGSAYYAIDFDRGAADLVGSLLANPRRPYGATFASDHRYVPSALRAYGHPLSAGQQVWLHRSKYTKGPPNYWYAFAGNPDADPASAWDPIAPTARLVTAPSDLAPSAPIQVGLSEPVVGLDASTLTLVDSAGAAVDAEVAYDPETGEAALVPLRPLALSATYRVTVSGVTDAAGNRLVDARWPVSTRIDEDPLARDVPVVLEAGTHDLVRFDQHGAVAERRTVDLDAERWLTAARRARIPGQAGSWLELAATDLAGWWVSESRFAHTAGLVDASLLVGADVTLPAGTYQLHGMVDGVPVADRDLVVSAERTVVVDRRVIVDGQLHLRLSDTGSLDGRWIRVGPSSAPSEANISRLLGQAARDEATVALDLGDWRIFRFDATGRVIDRRVVAGAEAAGLTTSSTLDVGGIRFFVLTGGELDGWAVREDPGVSVTSIPPAVEEHS